MRQAPKSEQGLNNAYEAVDCLILMFSGGRRQPSARRGLPECIEVPMSEVQLKGSVLVLMLYDVCEEIRLEELRRILGAQPAERSPSFKDPAPEYVRFERPPVVEPLERITLETGEQLEGRLKYYDYGVVCVEFELPFEGGWDMLVDLSCRYIAAPEVERHALQIAR